MSKDQTKRDLLPGTLGMLILRTLRRGPLHGYGIAQSIQQLSEDVLQVEEGSLYPALQRMELQGWIASEWGETARNRRARVYRLTPAGRKQLQRETASFNRILGAIARVMGSA
jgi:PadR family transcriptional regulator PadR